MGLNDLVANVQLNGSGLRSSSGAYSISTAYGADDCASDNCDCFHGDCHCVDCNEGND